MPRRAAAALTLALALTACSGDDGDGKPGGEDGPRGTAESAGPAAPVLGEPGRTWELRAEEIVPGGQFLPVSAFAGDDEVANPTALAVSDVLVTKVADRKAQEAEPLLVGVSGAGEVLWKGKGYVGCWAPGDTVLLCLRGQALVRVDPETGNTRGGAELSVVPGTSPVLDDGVIYLAVAAEGADENAYPTPFAVAALDAETLESVWPGGPAAAKDLAGRGSGSPALDLTGPNVTVAATEETKSGETDNYALDLDRATGEVVGTTHLGKGRFLERPWTVRRGFGNDRLEVYDGDTLAFETKGQPWDAPGGRLIADDRIGVGSTLHDLETGEPAWTRDDLGDELSAWRWSRDQRQVAVTGFDTEANEMTTTYLDARTGETQWSGAGTDGAPTETPEAFLQVESDYETTWTLRALDRTTGESAWSADLSKVGRENRKDGTEITGPYVSTRAVWAVGSLTLTGFTDFPD